MLCTEPNVLSSQIGQRPCDKPGGRKNRHSESDLSNNNQAPERQTPADSAHRTATLSFERRNQIRPSVGKRRDESEDNSNRDRNQQRKGKHVSIRVNVELERHRPISREEGYEDTRPKNSEGQSDGAARKGEKQTLR